MANRRNKYPRLFSRPHKIISFQMLNTENSLNNLINKYRAKEKNIYSNYSEIKDLITILQDIGKIPYG